MTPIQSKRLAKVVEVLASLKTASQTADWDDIVNLYGSALATDAAGMRMSEAGGSDLFELPSNPELDVKVSDYLTTEYGKDAVLADCQSFIDTANDNNDGSFQSKSQKYGWYLAMQTLGHGVGLWDYDYETTLPDDNIEVSAYITNVDNENETAELWLDYPWSVKISDIDGSDADFPLKDDTQE